MRYLPAAPFLNSCLTRSIATKLCVGVTSHDSPVVPAEFLETDMDFKISFAQVRKATDDVRNPSDQSLRLHMRLWAKIP